MNYQERARLVLLGNSVGVIGLERARVGSNTPGLGNKARAAESLVSVALLIP
jgi:hypothetical protein